MPDSLAFAVDVVQTIGRRFQSNAADLQLLVEAGSPFVDWLRWEAYLACRNRMASHPYCEVEARPSYASEGVLDDGLLSTFGDLRVGGPNDGADHCWLFAEIIVADSRAVEAWPPEADAATGRLLRLGWRKSAALLIIAEISNGAVEGVANESRPVLTEPIGIALAGGGRIAVRAFDIKRNPADVLRA